MHAVFMLGHLAAVLYLPAVMMVMSEKIGCAPNTIRALKGFACSRRLCFSRINNNARANHNLKARIEDVAWTSVHVGVHSQVHDSELPDVFRMFLDGGTEKGHAL